MSDLVLVVTLDVKPEARDDFRTYETLAARTMVRHGGRIERVVVAREAAPHREVHLVRFPSEAAFAAYRADPALAAAAHLRERSVVATTIVAGEDGPDYHAD